MLIPFCSNPIKTAGFEFATFSNTRASPSDLLLHRFQFLSVATEMLSIFANSIICVKWNFARIFLPSFVLDYSASNYLLSMVYCFTNVFLAFLSAWVSSLLFYSFHTHISSIANCHFYDNRNNTNMQQRWSFYTS